MLCPPLLSPLSSPHHLYYLFTTTNNLNLESNWIRQRGNGNGNYNGKSSKGCHHLWRVYRSISYRMEEDEEDSNCGSVSERFEQAVRLFNERDYYACHHLLESIWFQSNDPLRTLLHAILQCAVALYHLFNQNHKGAMMEMGEGVCKLRRLNFEGGPFYQFEQDVSAVLNFIYQTQLELAACNEDFCITMEQTERSYQLLDGFGAGQQLYFIDQGSNDESNKDMITYIVFDPKISYGGTGIPSTRVKLPVLQATLNDIMACENH